MSTWQIFLLFYIVDHNECPPHVTYFDSLRDQHDCLEKIRDTGKDLSLVDIESVQVQRQKGSFVNFVNKQVKFTRLLYDFHNPEPMTEEEWRKTPGHPHLRIVK